MVSKLAHSLEGSERAKGATEHTVHSSNVVVANLSSERSHFLLQRISNHILKDAAPFIIDNKSGLRKLFVGLTVCNRNGRAGLQVRSRSTASSSDRAPSCKQKQTTVRWSIPLLTASRKCGLVRLNLLDPSQTHTHMRFFSDTCTATQCPVPFLSEWGRNFPSSVSGRP